MEFPVQVYILSAYFSTIYTVDTIFPVKEISYQQPLVHHINCNKRHSTMTFPGDLANFQDYQ